MEAIGEIPSGPFQADAAGMGCMAIRTRSIREKLMPSLRDGKRLFWFGSLSEDMNFCLLMKEAGLQLFILPDVVVPHIGGAVGRWHHDKKAEEARR
jgi:hypothetical protein